MDKVDKVYQDLLKDILKNGTRKGDRTGTGTVSVFGRQVRFNMADGFPMLTTKKMFMKGVIHELLWFLNGDTNIKYLVDNGVNIWNGDAYKAYLAKFETFKKELGDDAEPISLEEFVEMIKNDINSSNFWGDLGPIYGKQWVDWGGYISMGHAQKDGTLGVHMKGINQIQEIIDTLKSNPNSRRIIVNAWNPADLDKMTLPPCHYGFQFNTVELTHDERVEYFFNNSDKYYHPHYDDDTVDNNGVKLVDDSVTFFTNLMNEDINNVPTHKLSLMWNQRSVDTFLGLPFNIASYALLLHMVAQQVNMVPFELIGSLGDTHLYTNHLEQANLLLSRRAKKLPTLELNKATSIFDYSYDDVKIVNYNSHPEIKAPLSN